MRTIIRDNYTPKNGDYHEKILIDEAQNKTWIFDCDGVFTPIPTPVNVVDEYGPSTTDAASQRLVTETMNTASEAIQAETEAREAADRLLQEEIEEIEMSSDVVDIVGTHAELEQYDTQHLKDNDIIKVLKDETRQNQTTYYRWSTSAQDFTYVGAEGPYYTESQVDNLLSDKADKATTYTKTEADALLDNKVDKVAGKGLSTNDFTDNDKSKLDGIEAGAEANVQSDWDQTDDTADDYIKNKPTLPTDFVGTDGTSAGTAGLVPAPATTDAGKYLKADGTWASIIIPQSGIPTDATFWGASYDSVNNKVDGTLAINPTNTANKMELSVGGSGGNGTYLQIKNGSETRYTAIRLYRDGADMPSPYGVNSGIEIVQAGIPQSLNQGVFVNGIAVPRTDYQAANKKYVDTQVASYSTMSGAGAPTTSTTGTVGQFYLDTTNDQMYYLAAITPQGTTPETYEYTWETVGGGGGIPTDATFWGASYDTTNNKVNGTMTFDDGAGHTATIVKAAGWSGQRASLNFGANAPTYLGNTQGTYVLVDGAGSNGISLITGNNQITFRSNLISLSSSNNTSVNLNNRSKIVNLKDPTAAQDAATKNYVDTAIAGASAPAYTPSEFNNLWENA